jgi:hypothetical protein
VRKKIKIILVLIKRNRPSRNTDFHEFRKAILCSHFYFISLYNRRYSKQIETLRGYFELLLTIATLVTPLRPTFRAANNETQNISSNDNRENQQDLAATVNSTVDVGGAEVDPGRNVVGFSIL